MKLMLAGLMAGALAFTPVATVVSTGALAQAPSCTDPTSPAMRPGGFCEQSAGTKSLSDPTSDTYDCPAIPNGAMLPDDFFLTPGARIEVAIAPSDNCLLARE
jgi:hypothetical protein